MPCKQSTVFYHTLDNSDFIWIKRKYKMPVKFLVRYEGAKDNGGMPKIPHRVFRVRKGDILEDVPLPIFLMVADCMRK